MDTPLPFGPRNMDQSSAKAFAKGTSAIISAHEKMKIEFVTLDFNTVMSPLDLAADKWFAQAILILTENWEAARF